MITIQLLKILYVSRNSRSLLSVTFTKTFDITCNKNTEQQLLNKQNLLKFTRKSHLQVLIPLGKGLQLETDYTNT